jgi:hypothetical protein
MLKCIAVMTQTQWLMRPNARISLWQSSARRRTRQWDEGGI